MQKKPAHLHILSISHFVLLHPLCLAHFIFTFILFSPYQRITITPPRSPTPPPPPSPHRLLLCTSLFSQYFLFLYSLACNSYTTTYIGYCRLGYIFGAVKIRPNVDQGTALRLNVQETPGSSHGSDSYFFYIFFFLSICF